MDFREALRLALDTLWSNRLRSFLTVLGNVVAVLAVVGLVSVIQGLNDYVSSEILATGSGSFTVTKFGMIMNYDQFLEALKRPDLTLDDARALEERLAVPAVVVPSLELNLSVKRGRESADGAPVRGVGPGYPAVGTFELSAGRHLGAADVQGRVPAAVIGHRIADRLFPAGGAVGMDMRVGGHRHTVIGVLEERGGTIAETRDDLILVPITTLLKHHGGRSRSLTITVRPDDPALIDEAREEVELHLKLHRGLKPWSEPDFDLFSDEQLYSLYQNLTAGIYGLLLGVVSLSLLVGGIVIMNIMLVSVTERTREIGIRKAVGAKRRDIVLQFLAESVLLAAAGGVIGVLAGIGVAIAVGTLTPLPARVELWSVMVGLLLASSVGLFFGIYPSWRASRLVPVAALRHEN